MDSGIMYSIRIKVLTSDLDSAFSRKLLQSAEHWDGSSAHRLLLFRICWVFEKLFNFQQKKEKGKKYTDHHESWIWPAASFGKLKFKTVITSITNIWASVRTTKSKRIPRQRNDFIQEQNLHAGLGTSVSFTWWLPRVSPHRASRSGLYTTLDMQFSTRGNTNARLIPSDFHLQVLDESRCYQQEEDNVSSNASAAQTQIEKTSARCHFPASYPEFTYQPIYCGEALNFQYRFSWDWCSLVR